ncbi:TetR/AcrR family transcriptional regulator C-terminal domain-containing protein [Cryptosporangium aurantiacum]|uniref:Tetracyclin repressor, C-terminal all-alpha domain n=1 Tax=Cryptosporangium aurantiacum TaxID=134849 RepID=A0A1M7R339_9ACTN|nr:TetR/AcrR family transcriptional regulator C-terminal domain-containing protein [Cryptosporangium aurantiacum]SHN39516.1 Tetracyclin repressor, C-terminal all-alpha domain [Cryptosporangium aurantiacum]
MATTEPTARRRAGSRAGLDRERILMAARGMDPDSLTMQAVADRLGVDRKALHYHVSDRAGLLRLVAADRFETHFLAAAADLAGEWREALVSYAKAIRTGLIAMGTLVDFFRFDPAPDYPSFAPVETLLRRMIDAGFSARQAGRALILVTGVAMMSARDEVLQATDEGHPQLPELRRALGTDATTSYPTLRALAQEESGLYDDGQFEFDLRVLIRGLEGEIGQE